MGVEGCRGCNTFDKADFSVLGACPPARLDACDVVAAVHRTVRTLGRRTARRRRSSEAHQPRPPGRHPPIGSLCHPSLLCIDVIPAQD